MLHTELRLRTCIELILHEEYYLRSDVRSFLEVVNDNCFNVESINTTVDDTYCGMWHIYALAYVLECPVYPDKSRHVRSLLNKTVYPRQRGEEVTPIAIMWTRTRPTYSPSSWTPNQFVPCVETHEQSISIESTPIYFP